VLISFLINPAMATGLRCLLLMPVISLGVWDSRRLTFSLLLMYQLEVGCSGEAVLYVLCRCRR
jgi:hypothetical protein